MDNKKNKNSKYSSKIISATLLAPALTNVVAHASVTDYSIINERSKLESSVNIAESFVNNIVLTDNEDKKILSADLLKPALDAALIILNNEESSLEDVVKINSILNKTLLFIKNTPTVKKSELQLSSKLDNIKKFISEAEESNDINKYPIAAMELISQKVDYCEELLKDRLLSSDTSMEVVEESLDESVKDFKSAISLANVDKAELKVVIQEGADFLKDVLVIGVKKGQYHKADTVAFDEILENARNVDDDVFATNEDVSRAIQDLRDWMAKMPEKQIKEDNILQDKIEEVDDFLVGIVFGDDLGNFSKEPLTDLNMSLDEAKANVNSDIVAGYRLYEMYENLIRDFEALKETEVLEVDKTELKSLIEDCERLYASIIKGEKPGQYYEKDYDELRAEIDKAIAVADNKQSNLALVNSTHSELQEFKNNFSSKEITYDSIKRDELESVLTEARDLYDKNNTNVGFDKGQYLLSALELLYEKTQEIDNICSDQTSSQKEIDAAKDSLLGYIEIFNSSKVTANKESLKNSLNRANQLILDTSEGSESGQYPTEARRELQEKINASKIVYETIHFEANQNEIDECVIQLDEQIAKYLKSEIIDFKLLVDVINEAVEICDNNIDNVGYNKGNCLEFSLVKLIEEVEKARQIHEKEGVTQAEVNIAKEELLKAIDTFNENIVTIDKTALKESIIEGQDILDRTTAGVNPGEYSEEHRKALYDAVEYGKIVYTTEHHVEPMISSATITLRTIIREYLDSVVKEEDSSDDNETGQKLDYSSLNNSINSANNLLANNPNLSYFKEIVDELNFILEAAEGLLNSNSGVQIELDNKAKELDDKRNDFVVAEYDYLSNIRTKLTNLITESNTLISKYNDNSANIGNSSLIVDSLKALEQSIEDAERILSLNGNTISEYDNEYKKLDNLKTAFKLLVYGDSLENEGPTNDNTSNDDSNVDNSTISEEEGKLVAAYKEKILSLLTNIKVALSTTEVGFDFNNCSENNKRATMYMYLMIESSLEDCERLYETKNLYNQAQATLLDFTNRSISITESGTVNGKNLTGVIKNLTKVPVGEVISDEEDFIPNAGMPIDVKAWMTALGSSFVGLGLLFKRKK